MYVYILYIICARNVRQKRGLIFMADKSNEKPKKRRTALLSSKEGGYVNQRNYERRHPDKIKAKRARYHNLRIMVHKDFKPLIDSLAEQEGLSLSKLFVHAVEEYYGVTIHKGGNKKEDDDE